MAQIYNIRTVSVPSVGKLPLGDDPGTFTPSGFKREHKNGRLPEDGGYTEMSEPARLDLNIRLLSGVDVVALNAIKDEDVTVRMADGQVFMLSQAYCAEPVQVTNGDSKLTLIASTSSKI